MTTANQSVFLAQDGPRSFSLGRDRKPAMFDCWLQVRNEKGHWEDHASFLADDNAQAMALAREIAPTGEIRVWCGHRRIA